MMPGNKEWDKRLGKGYVGRNSGVIYEKPLKAATDKKCPLITMQPFIKGSSDMEKCAVA